MSRESISKRTFITVTTVLAILAIASLALTLFGPGSALNESINGDKGRYFVEPTERGNGEYANSVGVLTYDYEGDYTASDYTALGYDKCRFSVPVMGGNAKNSTLWNTVVSEKFNPAMEFGKANSIFHKPIFNPTKTNGTTYIFETDFKFLGSEKGLDPLRTTERDPAWYLAFKFNSTNGNIYTLLLKYSAGDNYYCFTSSPVSGASSSDNYIFKVDEWYNLRFEYEVNSQCCTVFVNGHDLFTVPLNNSTVTHNEFSCVEIELRGYVKDMRIRLDNTFVNAVTN